MNQPAASRPIVFINNGWYLPGISGGDVHVMEVAARWARALNVTIAMPGWAYRREAKRLSGVRPIDTAPSFEGVPPWSFPGVCLRWALRAANLPRVQASLVVAASHYPYDLIPGLRLARRSACPLMVYVFHLPSMVRNRGRGGRMVRGWEPIAIRLLGHAALVAVDNDDVGRQLISRGVSAERITSTWNATAGPPLRLAEPRRADEVVYCGRITDSKGWQDLVVVGQHLRRHCPGTVLRVLGEGERKKDLARAVAAQGLNDVVRIEGFVDEATKWSALRRAAVFVSPSREEGWGIAVAEAVEAGAEVVCYNLPVYREVHGDGRLRMAPVGDVKSLSMNLMQALQSASSSPEKSDRGRAAAPSREAPRRGRSWDDIASFELRLADRLIDCRFVDADQIRDVAR